jgi:hypothetical protein
MKTVCVTRPSARRGLLAIVLCCLGSTTHADSQRVVDFGYDAAGNLISVDTQVQSAPPIIDDLSPAFINQGLTKAFTVTGNNLLGAEVTVSGSGLVLSEATTTLTGATFFLTAALDAPLGSATVSFTTLLGQADANLEVGARLPKLFSVPSPMVVPENSAPLPFAIHFDVSAPQDRTLTISTGDAALATVTPASVLLPGGASVFTVEITGIAIGSTSLQIFNPEFIAPLSLPLAVSASFSGDGDAHARVVGVFVPTADGSGPISPDTTFTRMGVRVGGAHVLPSTRVGVTVGDVGYGFQPLPVGINVGGNLARTISQPPLTGLIVGPMLFDTSPARVSRGADIDLVLIGVNLDSVDSVTLSPPDDVIVGPPSANPEGTRLTVPLSVAAGAAIGARQIDATVTGFSVPVLDYAVLEIEIE